MGNKPLCHPCGLGNKKVSKYASSQELPPVVDSHGGDFPLTVTKKIHPIHRSTPKRATQLTFSTPHHQEPTERQAESVRGSIDQGPSRYPEIKVNHMTSQKMLNS